VLRSNRSIWVLAFAAIAVRLVFIVLHRIDSDEPQHLHVAWAWTQGLIQYRDVFDNHFPLLHLIFAPLVRLMPETSAVFVLMRLAIAPVAIACSWLVCRLGHPLIGRERAAFAAIVFSVLPPWLPKSVEFRNDTLWIFFWLGALTLIAGRRRPAFLLAGVAAALCLLTSVKALPLLLAHALALASQRQTVPSNAALRIAGGAAIPLAALAVFMVAHGAFDEMLHATLLFNASLPVDASRRIGGAVAFAFLAPVLARAQTPGPASHLKLFAVWYSVLLLCFWPLLTPRDFLPLVPLAALAIAATRFAPAMLFVAATLSSVWYAELWRPVDLSRQRFLDAAVHLTTRNDYVFDLKGDAVFRRRPVFQVYEAVSRALTSKGILADRGPEQIVARRSCVAIADATHIPARTRAFLNEHFVTRGAVRVCGAVTGSGTFAIAVPETYAVIARNPGRVTIDGVAYRGPRHLAAGPHTLASPDREPVTIIWSRAVRNGS
jgi:hypothetical protein